MSRLFPASTKNRVAVFLFLFFICSVFTSSLEAKRPEAFDYKSALDFSQKAIGNRVGDYALTGTDHETHRFSQLLGKPLVLSLVFTSCHQICPMTIQHLAKVVEKARDSLGDESFEVVVIGFDTAKDTPDAMRHFARQQGIEETGWHLFSIAPEEIEKLSRDVGFLYYPSARGFDHLIQATIIDAEGKVYRQVYGQVFDTPLLVEPLKELILGRPQPSQGLLANLVNRVRFFCTTYDPVRDTYYFDYSLFISLTIGGSIILFVFIWMIRELRYRKRLLNSSRDVRSV